MRILQKFLAGTYREYKVLYKSYESLDKQMKDLYEASKDNSRGGNTNKVKPPRDANGKNDKEGIG